MARLRFTQDDKPLFVYTLRAGRTVIGRSDACDVALPSELVSRIHCHVERGAEGWRIEDHSRHGTTINGDPKGPRILSHGDVLGIGPYLAELDAEDADGELGPTATRSLPQATHERVIEVDATGFVASRARIRFSSGPRVGDRVMLIRPRVTMGGPGAKVVLDSSLPEECAVLHVVQGRVMVGPRDVPVFVAGQRIRELIPVFDGEEIRIGEHGLIVERVAIEEQGRELSQFGDLIGGSPGMRRLFGVLERMAMHESPVLLVGESGTGKELAARAVHDGGPRGEGPFVALNCAALPESLVESELFGYEKGAFSGATSRRDGAFHRADGGTLFLDEIGEMSLLTQAKVLRVLESGEVCRVGGEASEFPDVRVVSATHRNLPKMVQDGTFRADLFFRLVVLTGRIPPLRERREDIGLLVDGFVKRDHPHCRITQSARDALCRYEWPGNVRELRNVLIRACAFEGPTVDAAALEFNPWAFESTPSASWTTDDAEREAILRALERSEGNRSQASRDLGIARSTLVYKMRRLGIDAEKK